MIRKQDAIALAPPPDLSDIPASDEDTNLLRTRPRVPADVGRPPTPTVILSGDECWRDKALAYR